MIPKTDSKTLLRRTMDRVRQSHPDCHPNSVAGIARLSAEVQANWTYQVRELAAKSKRSPLLAIQVPVVIQKGHPDVAGIRSRLGGIARQPLRYLPQLRRLIAPKVFTEPIQHRRQIKMTRVGIVTLRGRAPAVFIANGDASPRCGSTTDMPSRRATAADSLGRPSTGVLVITHILSQPLSGGSR